MAKQKVIEIKVEKDEKGIYFNLDGVPQNAQFIIEQDIDGIEHNKEKGIHQLESKAVEKKVTKAMVETIEGLGINEKGYCELLKSRVIGYMVEKEDAVPADEVIKQ